MHGCMHACRNNDITRSQLYSDSPIEEYISQYYLRYTYIKAHTI